MDLIPWVGRFILLGLLYIFLIYALRVILGDLRTPQPALEGAGAQPLSSSLPQALLGEAAGALEVVSSEGAPAPGTRYAIDGEARIGRDEGCAIRLFDAYVSHEHARIFLRGDRYWIEDLQSTNGTLLNGKSVSAPQHLTDEDRITIGAVTLRFTAPAPRR